MWNLRIISSMKSFTVPVIHCVLASPDEMVVEDLNEQLRMELGFPESKPLVVGYCMDGGKR